MALNTVILRADVHDSTDTVVDTVTLGRIINTTTNGAWRTDEFLFTVDTSGFGGTPPYYLRTEVAMNEPSNDIQIDSVENPYALAQLEFRGSTKVGLVPGVSSASGKFLKDDGTWDTPAGTGTGETNTGQNVGTDGVGVYDGKSASTLQFRHVAPASNKVTVALNGSDIDVDVAESNLSIAQSQITDIDIFDLVKESDETISNSTTLQDDDLFQNIVIVADDWYRFECFLDIATFDATMDFRLKWVFSQAPQVQRQRGVLSVAANTADGASQTVATSMTTEVQMDNLTNLANNMLFLTGVIRGHATNDGFLKLQWAQGVQTANNLTVKAGSYFTKRRIKYN